MWLSMLKTVVEEPPFDDVLADAVIAFSLANFLALLLRLYENSIWILYFFGYL